MKRSGMYLALAVFLTAPGRPEAQIRDDGSMAWKVCAASPSPSCLAELALSQTSARYISASHLMQAGFPSQAMAHWKAFGSDNKADEANVLMSGFSARIRSALLDAKRDGSTAQDLKSRLQTIDAEMPQGLERHGQPLSRTDIYRDAAELMARGAGASSYPGEVLAFGWPERSALQRHLPSRFGSSLDVFVERARELAIQEKAWMSFARAMAEIGRRDEARWALRQLGPETRPRSNSSGIGCWSRFVDLMLGLGEFREADRILGDAPCYEQQRAEIAERYAQSGEAGRAKEIAYGLLARLPDYMRAFTGMLDGPRLGDTVHPLISALVLAGERERALTEMREIERFVGSEGRNLTSFVGVSLGMSEVAQIYYEMGEEAKADALVEAIAGQDDDPTYPLWSRPFALAYAKCASGKRNCLDVLLSFSGETMTSGAGGQILAWAARTGRKDVTTETIRQRFTIVNAWLLDYSTLSLEVLTGDEAAATRTLRLLIDQESRSDDLVSRPRCILLLRLAVAMENRELAIEAARLILWRTFNGTPADSANENAGRDQESVSETSANILAESAAVLAPLP